VERIDCAVIGAGIVGLAVARALARAGREVLVLEAEPWTGSHTSSRNSEVIHAGIYYPPGSLKARLCVEGKALLYRFCSEYGVPHARLGKLLVAVTHDEVATLAKYRATAAANGVLDLEWLTAADARALEPEVRCVAAVHSPSTGIVDSHALMLALQGDAEAHGAALALRAPVVGGRAGADGIVLEVGGEAPTELACATVINSAGLFASRVARSVQGVPPASIPRTWFAKGNYFTLAGRSPFRRLVYPMPSAGGLGVHVTLDLGGQVRFGPDVSAWLDEELDYAFDESRAAAFYAEIRRYYPALREGALQPGYTGLRPKISGPGEPAADFRVHAPTEHGVAGWFALYGIESPGLTASLALAALVAGLVTEDAARLP
jgi:L-2-hydroxyglutarate oxidase LhgO